jgi:hypothetical protein
MNKEKTICGKTEKEIRNAYFSKRVSELLADIQKDGKISTMDLEELLKFLADLRKEEKELIENITKEVGFENLGLSDELKPPSIDDLTKKLSAEEQVKFDNWRIEVDLAKQTVSKIIKEATEKAFNGKEVEREKWLDWGLTIANLSRHLDADRVYKDQLYRKRMIDIIDTYGVSRKEAEERSKITQEYSDYKNAVLFKDNLEEIIRICKKKGGYEY